MIDSFKNENAFLSNFFPVEIEFDGVVYPSVEHAYQAAKTLNLLERDVIKNAKSPGKAKRLGATVTLRTDFQQVKFNNMLMFLRQKFSNELLRWYLLATGDELLVEGNNWHDNYWGNCICSKCSDKEGQNHLGQMLMMIRFNLLNDINGLQNT